MKKVVIAAGHGGKDPGAVGNGVNEKDLALQIALKIGYILARNNVHVVQTRKTDVFVSLADQAKIANDINADLLLSVHLNSAENKNARGVETFSYPKSATGRKLARAVQRSVIQSAIFVGDRGCKEADFAVLRLTKMPAALVELGFISNKEDVLLVQQNINAIADAVAVGILTYLEIVPAEGSASMDGETIFKLLNEYLKGLPTTETAKKASAKGIASGLFVDGSGDGLVDNPRGFVTREQLAIVLDRAGLLD